MSKLVVSEFISLDGVIENPMWTFPYWNDEIAAFKGEETNSAGAILLGRVTYEGFAASWPGRPAEEGGDFFNNTAKHVASKTLNEPLEWNNSHLIKGDVAEGVAKLKRESAHDFIVYGSGVLVNYLMRHNLVDQLNLLIYPVVLGSGQRLFEDGNKFKLKLVESKSFSSGVVAAVYEPESE